MPTISHLESSVELLSSETINLVLTLKHKNGWEIKRLKHWEFEKVFSLIIANLKKTSFRINNGQKFFVRLDPGLLKKAGIGTRARLFCYAPIWLSSSEEYFFSHIKDLKESELISSGKEISKDLQIGTTTS